MSQARIASSGSAPTDQESLESGVTLSRKWLRYRYFAENSANLYK